MTYDANPTFHIVQVFGLYDIFHIILSLRWKENSYYDGNLVFLLSKTTLITKESGVSGVSRAHFRMSAPKNFSALCAGKVSGNEMDLSKNQNSINDHQEKPPAVFIKHKRPFSHFLPSKSLPLTKLTVPSLTTSTTVFLDDFVDEGALPLPPDGLRRTIVVVVVIPWKKIFRPIATPKIALLHDNFWKKFLRRLKPLRLETTLEETFVVDEAAGSLRRRNDDDGSSLFKCNRLSSTKSAPPFAKETTSDSVSETNNDIVRLLLSSFSLISPLTN
uniref:Uncharacterized protein n=1 Tax=Romanomermis culicivorax TaxID=13658 RepID=A0A915J7J0_ROMCU